MGGREGGEGPRGGAEVVGSYAGVEEAKGGAEESVGADVVGMEDERLGGAVEVVGVGGGAVVDIWAAALGALLLGGRVLLLLLLA